MEWNSVTWKTECQELSLQCTNATHIDQPYLFSKFLSARSLRPRFVVAHDFEKHKAMWHWLDAKGNLDATQFWSKLWGQSRCKRRSLGQLPSKVSSQCLASWASSSRFCHHRASFRILTFYQNRFFWVPSDHIVDKIASEIEVASLQKQLFLLTLLKRRGSVTRRFWYPGLASVFGLKNIFIDFAATSENEIEIEMLNIILETFFSETSKLSKPYTGKVETGYHEIVHVTSDSGINIWVESLIFMVAEDTRF